MAIGNQHGLEGSKVCPKYKSLLQFDLKKNGQNFLLFAENVYKIAKK